MSPWNSTLKSGKPLAKRSAKRVIEDREFAKVRAFVMDRDEWSCQTDKASTGVLHMGEIDPHHRISRARDSERALDPDNLIALCRRHHDWVHAHPLEAEALGLLKSAPLLSPHPNQGNER